MLAVFDWAAEEKQLYDIIKINVAHLMHMMMFMGARLRSDLFDIIDIMYELNYRLVSFHYLLSW